VPSTDPSASRAATRRAAERRTRVRLIRDVLRSSILHGAYSATKMPPEHELMVIFNTSRVVIREVLALLADEGLIDRVRGYGTYSLQPPQTHDLYDIHGIGHTPGTGFWQSVTHTRVFGHQVTATPGAVAALMPGAGPQCVQLDYLAYSGAEAVAIGTNYFRLPHCAAVADLPIRTDFYELLERAGIEIGASRFLIGAVAADPNLAATFEVPAHTPFLSLEQTVYSPAGEAVDVAFVWIRADRVLLDSFVAGPGFTGRAQLESPELKKEAKLPATAVTTKIAQTSSATSITLPTAVTGLVRDDDTDSS
jgi:GntR family transcriptional regulator